MPLCQENVIDALSGLDTKAMMGKPYPKHHYKDVYFDDFEQLGLLDAKNQNIQIAGGIERVFLSLLSHAVIGARSAKSGDPKRRLSALCLRWGRAANEIFADRASPTRAAFSRPSLTSPIECPT